MHKLVLRRKFIALNICIRKAKQPQINKLTFHLRKLEKEEQIKFIVSRFKEIIRIRVEINEIENRKIIQKTNKSKQKLFFEMINKIINL